MKQKKTKTIIFGGGLDLVTPALSVDPGRLLEVKNYECDLNGGYRVTAGFERFDGRQSPSDSSFFAIATGAFTGTFTLLETITGGTSGATGVLVTIGVQGLYLVSITGTFVTAEVLTGGSSGATATSSTAAFANITVSSSEVLNDVRYDKEIYFRDLIGVVPGINAVRGVFRHEAVTLAVRDFDGSEARMYKATTSGWTQVTASHIIFFDTKVSGFPLPGTTINDGVGNTAVLHRVGLGVIASTTGYIVVTGYTAGFAIASLIKDGGTTIATTTVAADAVTLLPAGKNEWVSHNFTGGVDFDRVYTADGVNPAMEYDPVADVLSPVYSDQDNQATDIPTFITEHRNHLWIGYDRGITRNSEPGDPFLWDAIAGTLEIAVGSAITGFDSGPSSLVIGTRKSTRVIKGKTIADFELDIASKKTGAIAYTMQHIGTTYMVEDRGIIELSRVQAFGDFANATVSRLIQPLLKKLKSLLNTSTLNQTNNIYKIFTSDGRGISLTFQEGDISGFSFYDYGVNINVMSNAEDENGDERIFFGGDDGYVFEQDKGVSFDGAEKEAWLRTVFQHLNSPTIRKRFYRGFFDVSLDGTASVSIQAEYSNGSGDSLPTDTFVETVTGFNSQWDIGQWDVAKFDATVTSEAYVDLTGTGDSISLILYSSSAKDDIFTIKDVVYHYKHRRALRNSR